MISYCATDTSMYTYTYYLPRYICIQVRFTKDQEPSFLSEQESLMRIGTYLLPTM